MSLFVVIRAFERTGYGQQAVQALAASGVDVRSAPTLALALVTATLSNLVGNTAAVMLLLKVAPPDSLPQACVLSLANSFCGSLLVVASVSNLIVVQQARALGVRISFTEFARLGAAVTLASLAGLLAWAELVGAG